MWGDARRLSRKKGVNHKVEVNLLKGTEKDTRSPGKNRWSLQWFVHD